MGNQDLILNARNEYQKTNKCFVDYDDDWYKICEIALDKLRSSDNTENGK